jgi:hypothetical protein
LTALRPSIATIPGAKLLCISTAYAKAGVLFEAYREHYRQQMIMLLFGLPIREP